MNIDIKRMNELLAESFDDDSEIPGEIDQGLNYYKTPYDLLDPKSEVGNQFVVKILKQIASKLITAGQFGLVKDDFENLEDIFKTDLDGDSGEGEEHGK